MKNILNEKPKEQLEGRLKFSVGFIDPSDIRNKKILDIGCGYGWFELLALKKGAKEITGIEIDEESIKTARTNIRNKKAKFLIGGALALPDKRIFDTIVSWEVIEHIPKDSEAIMFKEVNKVLKKNGVFYLSTPHSTFFSNFSDPAWLLVGHRHYSLRALADFANKTGFAIEKIAIKGGFWSIIYLINVYVSKWVFRRDPFWESFMRKKDDQEYSYQENGYMNIFLKLRKIRNL